ncbi:UDP-4-amino-4,6-dideoxy-N-acetyl-beta-L-altrosamine transaminase [Legionella maioricensis]|uniref:UDP-4-amino-4, 6-dideoxy-N-acetyl-beta-L-altrosamine transaminase n=1 Tax=Legionella maioricensis TaxID=2896528 RepID=A0A9X2CZC4_9GAMM|nr:UDP-4-amino-4,6-dideoxy-N-acetyl-beta-L-altrosamine transaminase [Legionella maioricensis]MCL9683578.1 UDP-4-amino-4,6-dideoxy-N-acetyl-beta-L-altrosamine transaminase [Legionella maioricensis]MCL9686877.1 UDP-4-amino-4,6-dideoxy-N-acetyl-beta-L-altrosamine transaminase [Legionella maioricensis]
MIPYGRQDITEADIAAVVEVLQSDWLTQGPMVPRFEQAVASKVGAQYAVAVNSATSALHLACLALDLGPGDWLWTSPNTFVASANCGLYCGAKVDFVDIDPLTYNLSVEALTLKLEQAERSGTLPKIVIPVHFSGQSCNMAEIHALSQRYGFKIIEDASHAIGSRYKGQPVGNCRYSDITVFSFHPVKIITTAEGGMALTNNSMLAERMQRLRAHGITRDLQQIQDKSQGAFYYEQIDLGFNYRMTDIQAALGLSQLERLEQFVTQRQHLASVYDRSLIDLPLVRPFQHPDTYSAFHLYVVQVDVKHSPLDRNALLDYLRKAGIGVNVHYIPVHTHPYYRKINSSKMRFVEAENYYANAITLPLFFGLQESQQGEIIEVLTKVLQK